MWDRLPRCKVYRPRSIDWLSTMIYMIYSNHASISRSDGTFRHCSLDEHLHVGKVRSASYTNISAKRSSRICTMSVVCIYLVWSSVHRDMVSDIFMDLAPYKRHTKRSVPSKSVTGVSFIKSSSKYGCDSYTPQAVFFPGERRELINRSIWQTLAWEYHVVDRKEL